MTSKSLYVHIPFCRSKCAYCDFFSRGESRFVPDTYLDALIRELSFYTVRYGIEQFRTVYLGGGTPSLLSPPQLSRLLHAACSAPLPPEEVTVEMNPESLSEDLLAVFADCPAERKRLSLGIQSLQETALNAVNRHCTAQEARKALDLTARYWRGDLCLDLIAGLPCQTDTAFLKSLHDCLAYRPQHVSLYSLTVEEGTPLYTTIGSMDWNADEADGQWIAGKEALEAAGFRQYEVSNFCREDHESRHNMTYWMQKDYIGIGSGATGSIYAFSGEGGLRWTNTRDIAAYSAFWNACDRSGNSAGSTGEAAIPCERERLTLEIEEEEFLMMGLRSTYGISAGEYRRRFPALEPWHGRLECRLGVRGGAWERFSALDGMASGCKIRREGDDVTYAFEGKALSFLNRFLRLLA